MPRKSSPSRFVLRLPTLEAEKQPKAESPGAVLNKALRMAENSEDPGVWEVIEWDDVIYRVHRLDTEDKKLDVRVEIVR